MLRFIEKIYDAGQVIGQGGEEHKLDSAIDQREGKFIYDIISADQHVLNTLEIGCAYGLSSLFICAALQNRPGAEHTIIDPFQTTQWDGAGKRNLEDAGVDFFNLLELRSEFALPRLVEQKEGQVDFIFVDGWHTFDHALVDCFYATRLLRVGGYLVIDDVSFPSIQRVVSYLKNYPCYEEHAAVIDKGIPAWRKTLATGLAVPINRKTWAKILAPGIFRKIFNDRKVSTIALKKVRPDNRNWNWHADAF